MHLAETKEQALKDVEWGMNDFLGYFGTVAPPRPDAPKPSADVTPIDILEQGFGATIGTPDDAIETLERLWEKTGGFGGFLLQDHNWADFAATKKSYELFARYVRPWFKQANKSREASLDAYRVRNDELMGNVYRTADKAIEGFKAPETVSD
jgi:limonene 1,2-monooxygenase